MIALTQPRAAHAVTPRHAPSILTYEQAWRAHTALVVFDITRLSDDELAALSVEIETEIQLDRSDLAAGDFSRIPDQILRNGIALAEAQYDEATREMQRRARARTLFAATGIDVATAMAPRWDTIRALDIVESLRILGVPLRKRGREYWACCPFHEEQTPSFAVNQEKGVWCCYGCQLGGDLITFIEHREHLSKGGALRFAEQILLGEVAA